MTTCTCADHEQVEGCFPGSCSVDSVFNGQGECTASLLVEDLTGISGRYLNLRVAA